MSKNNINEKIDFVILWVDGNDEKWLEEKEKYSNVKGDSSKNRFRDYGNLQYLFRGIEKFAPWVNKVYFITWGHLPKWLDVNNEKLVIVKHEEFIPAQYLPTFNSNVIEMNLHRIKNLSEKFVLFNDDLFILKKLKPTDFFENDLPKDMYIEYIKQNCSHRHEIMKKNYMSIIDKYFKKEEFIKENIFKVLNPIYGIQNLKTILNFKNKNFCDFYSQHLTQPFLKEIFRTVWDKEYQKIDEACKNKFRADNDLGTTMCRYWQLLSGKFQPSKAIGKYFEMSDDNTKIMRTIEERKYKIICINDAKISINFEKAKREINGAFEKILNKKSKFEI